MVSLEDLHKHPARSRMVVSVGRNDVFEEVLSQRVDDSRQAGRRWTRVSADLSPWAGQRVTLRLELVPDVPTRRSDLTWWGSPRIAGLPPGN